MNLFTRQKQTHIKNKFTVTEGDNGGGIKSFGLTYTHYYI